MNDKISQLNLIKQNVRRIVYIGFASPSQYKELNQNLEMLLKLESEVKKDNYQLLQEINDFKKVLREKIEKENKKQHLAKTTIKASLLTWLMKK